MLLAGICGHCQAIKTQNSAGTWEKLEEMPIVSTQRNHRSNAQHSKNPGLQADGPSNGGKDYANGLGQHWGASFTSTAFLFPQRGSAFFS